MHINRLVAQFPIFCTQRLLRGHNRLRFVPPSLAPLPRIMPSNCKIVVFSTFALPPRSQQLVVGSSIIMDNLWTHPQSFELSTTLDTFHINSSEDVFHPQRSSNTAKMHMPEDNFRFFVDVSYCKRRQVRSPFKISENTRTDTFHIRF